MSEVASAGPGPALTTVAVSAVDSPMRSVGGVAESVTWTSADAGGGAFSGIAAVLFAGLASSAFETLADTHRPTTDASTRVRMRT